MDLALVIAELSNERARLDKAISVLEQFAGRKPRTQIRIRSKEDGDRGIELMTPRAISSATRRSSESIARRGRRP